MAKIKKEQLERIQALRRTYAVAKLRIAEIEIEKQGLFVELHSLSKKIEKEEELIKEEHGEKAVIDLKTGEVLNGNS